MPDLLSRAFKSRAKHREVVVLVYSLGSTGSDTSGSGRKSVPISVALHPPHIAVSGLPKKLYSISLLLQLFDVHLKVTIINPPDM